MKFRGAKMVGDKAEIVEGVGCVFVGPRAYILTESGASEYKKVQVIPASVSTNIYIEGLGHIYCGDIVRYTFKEKNEYYNRYYVVRRDVTHLVKFRELYRDYTFDDNYKIVRGKFRNHYGDARQIDKPMSSTEAYTLLGNVYENPEWEK